jgi:hypothetical protein
MLTERIRGFIATLPSNHPGIFFTATITGIASEATNFPHDPEPLATAIRLTLREAAKDVTCRTSPADLAEATDMCNQRLAAPLPVPQYSEVHVTATVKLSLSAENQKALNEFLAAQRSQGIRDLLQQQHASAIRDYFTDPALMLAWWLDRAAGTLENLPKAEHLQAIADTFKKYPKVAEYPIEYQILDLARTFVAEFPEVHQRRALLELLGNGFQRAGLDGLARQAESLLTNEKYTNGMTDQLGL